MLTKMIYAAIATLAVTSNTAQPVKAVMIVCEAVRSSPLPQTDDFHDATVHHRYYGRWA